MANEVQICKDWIREFPCWDNANQSSMRTAPEIKSQLIETLTEVLDEPLKAVGFARNKRSLVYCRQVNGTEHRITFTVHCHPKYQLGAEAHIYPSLQVLMPEVTSGMVYDYKFTLNPSLSPARVRQIMKNGPAGITGVVPVGP